MPARSYLLDTVDRNLVEMLIAADYDVWLFDYRASTDLPTASSQFALDEIATGLDRNATGLVKAWPDPCARIGDDRAVSRDRIHAKHAIND